MPADDHTTSIDYREIARFPGYRFGDDGSVWSKGRGGEWKLLKPWLQANQYLRASLGRGNKRYVHHLIAEAFRGLRPGGAQVRHLNGIRQDNRAVNLAYGSPQDNGQDAVWHGTTRHGLNNPFAALSEAQVQEIRSLEQGRLTNREIADRFGVCPGTAGNILRGHTWRRLTGASPPKTGSRRGVIRMGEEAAAAKLTEEQVREVFSLREQGVTQKAIGLRFGVSQTAIWYIIHGRNWKHVL